MATTVVTLSTAIGLNTDITKGVFDRLRSLPIARTAPLSGRIIADTGSAIERMVYGVICFATLFSLVGTILGGIWADQSWGRFWGWDPKENGALMIVLWSLAILHARLGGFIKEWGLHLTSIFGAIVVGFSWWHVNFLNVGLHNYGFAAEKKWAVMAFYGLMLFFIAWGGTACLIERMQKKRKPQEAVGGGMEAETVS